MSAGAFAVALGAIALALGGCGLAVGPAPSGVQLLVTRSFGARVLHGNGGLKAASGQTVMGLLRSEDAVRTSSSGRIVQSIDGAEGAQGDSEGWFYYVNGLAPRRSANATPVQPGDHIWWDLHRQVQGLKVPAVVGAFPEPFLNGSEGRRFPVRVECASGSAAACETVAAALRRVNVPAAISALGSGSAPETLRVMVAPWGGLETLQSQNLARGPRASGVYARFAEGGSALVLLGETGEPVQTLHGGVGLIAATRQEKEAPVWLITGTDQTGVELAARAFDQTTLADRFAVALTTGGSIALPDLR